MKKIIISLILIFSVTPAFCAQQPPFSPQQKVEAITGYVIKMLDELIEKNIINTAHLQRLQESSELINPMTAADRAASSTNLVYAKGLDSFIAQGKQFIDVARVKDWALAKIAELEHAEDTRKQVHEDTREIHRSMKFVELPAGKYVDSITHEEFEMPEGIEIQDTPVTQWQWFTAMGANPAHFVDGPDAEAVKTVKMRADASVETVCWNDVQTFISTLNQQNNGYVYALPSFQDYQVVMQIFQQKGAFVEYHGKRVLNITGNIWQWTRDTVEAKDKQAHLVFGGISTINEPGKQIIKDLLHPVFCNGSQGQSLGLRLIRFSKHMDHGTQKLYTNNQLSWNQVDGALNSDWQWSDIDQLYMFKDEGLRWVMEHNDTLSRDTQYSLETIYNKNSFSCAQGWHDEDTKRSCLVHATSIRADENQLSDISWFIYLSNLKEAVIQENRIYSINALKDLVHLESLLLSSNFIRDASPLANAKNLGWLNLDNNWIEDLHFVSNLSHLKKLYLSHNQIKDVTPLAPLIHLEELFLRSNRIENIASLAQLFNLRVLDLSENYLTNIAPLSHLINIESLDLSNNEIEDLDALSGLNNLRRLYLNKCTIQSIDALNKLTNLTWLKLSHNAIKDIQSLTQLTKLYSLELSHNNIKDIRPLSNMIDLKYLNLRGNPIEDLKPLIHLKNLRHLWLDPKQIEDLHARELLPGVAIYGTEYEDRNSTENDLIKQFSYLTDARILTDFGNKLKVLGNFVWHATWLVGPYIYLMGKLCNCICGRAKR